MGWLRRLYDWTMGLAAHPKALWALAAVAFIESSVFPIPPDVLLIPLVLAAPKRAFVMAGVATIASVMGGFAGYAIGAFLYEQLAQPILEFYSYQEKFVEFQGKYNEWGFWIVIFAGFTPFPFKVITIASGATGLDLGTFLIASLLSRAARFFLVAALLWRFGAPIKAFIERYLGLLTLIFFALLIGGFLLLRYLF